MVAEVSALAREVPEVQLVMFFDEVNTSRCLGLFKELFIDRTIAGREVPPNLFFVGAINPYIEAREDAPAAAPQSRYDVYPLPPALADLRISLPSLEGQALDQYIVEKLSMFRRELAEGAGLGEEVLAVLEMFEEQFSRLLSCAHGYIRMKFGESAVSQRDIQRVFTFITFLLRLDAGARHADAHQRFRSAVYMAVALVSARSPPYHEQPPQWDHPQRALADAGVLLPARGGSPPRRGGVPAGHERLCGRVPGPGGGLLHAVCGEICRGLGDGGELRDSVGYRLQQGPAREHLHHRVLRPDPRAARYHRRGEEPAQCSMLLAPSISDASLGPLPLSQPGTSKTLSFHIVLANLRGQDSPRAFCRQFLALEPFFLLCNPLSSESFIAQYSPLFGHAPGCLTVVAACWCLDSLERGDADVQSRHRA
jgi:hypothetical protein